MRQLGENSNYEQKCIDIPKGICYTEYVGRPIWGRSFFLGKGFTWVSKDDILKSNKEMRCYHGNSNGQTGRYS